MTLEELALSPAYVAQFWASYTVVGACWEWTRTRNARGYGRVSLRRGRRLPGKRAGVTLYAHRLAYMLTYGDIPEGLYVLHRCDNPSCIHPDHLFLGTQSDNLADMVAKGRARAQGQRSPRKSRARFSREERLARRPRGAGHYKARLTDEQVYAIRDRAAAGERLRALAREFGVDDATVAHIVARRTWTHLPDRAPVSLVQIESWGTGRTFSIAQVLAA